MKHTSQGNLQTLLCTQHWCAVRQGCRNPGCEDEALYMGVEKRNGVVITEEGHKWSNAEYFALTGIKEYAPYMFGGGCGRPRSMLTAITLFAVLVISPVPARLWMRC